MKPAMTVSLSPTSPPQTGEKDAVSLHEYHFKAMRRDLLSSASSTTQRGFSMLEVLITLVIVATALLGTAGLQVYAMRVNQSGQFRTMAVFLASDIAERMEVNKAAAVAANYHMTALTSASSVADTACDATACTPAQLAAWDISQWGQDAARLLPQASWQICIDMDRDNVCDTAPAATNPVTYRIFISWQDRNNAKALNNAGTVATVLDSYSATRTLDN